MKNPEAYEKDDICKFLDTLPNCWYFRPMMGAFGKAGVPDIIGCYHGLFFGIEVKRPGKEPTVLQYRILEEVSAAGGIAFWGVAEKVIAEFQHWVKVSAL